LLNFLLENTSVKQSLKKHSPLAPDTGEGKRIVEFPSRKDQCKTGLKKHSPLSPDTGKGRGLVNTWPKNTSLKKGLKTV
jgi:hypothetical protein